jgi:hypothetical protein
VRHSTEISSGVTLYVAVHASRPIDSIECETILRLESFMLADSSPHHYQFHHHHQYVATMTMADFIGAPPGGTMTGVVMAGTNGGHGLGVAAAGTGGQQLHHQHGVVHHAPGDTG